MQIDTKEKMAHSARGYRTREMFNKTNQSTNFIQMSPRLLDFGKAMQNEGTMHSKRMRKPNKQQYEKNVLTARRTRAMRDEAKYNADKW